MYEELIERLDGVKSEIGLALDEGYAWTAQVIDEAAEAIEKLSCMIEKNTHVIENLKDSQHYSGRYVKAIMGVEE